MPSRESKMATAKTVISALGSVAAATMVARSVLREYLPPEIKDYVYFTFRNFIHRFSTQLTVVIHEAGNGFSTNEIYDAAQIYLATKITPAIHRLKVSKPSKSNTIDVAIEPQEAVQDTYDGVKINWVLVHRKTPRKSQYNRYSRISETRSDERSFELSFHRKHKETVLNEYIPFIVNEAKMKKKRNNTLQIYTVNGMDKYTGKPSSWSGVNLDHPATFATLAMDADVKEFLMKDLERFVERREYYRHVGKAWKRGYLLYGPPGTGKSSLIAAMANFLNFDIYDLELTDVKRNSELRRLLVNTANQSILVVEDIDCSVELHDRVATEGGSHIQDPANRRSKSKPHHEEPKKVTLSGFLNFIDGLWSSCGDERIIVFTTNRKDKLDPALLRPGRMDVHIHMSYCTPQGFRILASNYLGVTDHNLFGVIVELIKTTEVTPAEVAEELLKNDDHDLSLSELVNFLHGKRKGKAKKEHTQSTSASTITFTKHSSDLTLANSVL